VRRREAGGLRTEWECAISKCSREKGGLVAGEIRLGVDGVEEA